MAVTLSATIAAQSIAGQNVIVNLNSSDTINKLPLLTVGQTCTISSGATGYIYSIDKYGSSFEIKPITPDKNFQSTSQPGYLAAGDTITIN